MYCLPHSTINDRRCEWNTNCALGSTANIPWIGQRLSVFLKAKNKDRVNIRKPPSKIRRLNTKAGTTKSSQLYSFLIPKKRKTRRHYRSPEMTHDHAALRRHELRDKAAPAAGQMRRAQTCVITPRRLLRCCLKAPCGFAKIALLVYAIHL